MVGAGMSGVQSRKDMDEPDGMFIKNGTGGLDGVIGEDGANAVGEEAARKARIGTSASKSTALSGDSKNNTVLGCARGIVDPNSFADINELDKIFQEKLFIRKRMEEDKENAWPGAADEHFTRAPRLVLKNTPFNGRPLSDRPLNIPRYSKLSIEESGGMFNEISLKGVYQADIDEMEDKNMADIYKTKELLLTRSAEEDGGDGDYIKYLNSTPVKSIEAETSKDVLVAGSPERKCGDVSGGGCVDSANGHVQRTVSAGTLRHTAGNSNVEKSRPCSATGSKRDIHEIEEEFNRLRSVQLESLRLKSKIYRFIYAEISKIDQKYSEHIKKLESENEELKATVENINKKYEKYREHVNENVSKNIEKFKMRVIAAMKEYKKRCKGRL